MGTNLWKVILSCFCFFIMSQLFGAPNNTENYWQCDNRSGGSWAFGRAPDICDLDHFMPSASVYKLYGKQIFDDSVSQDYERLRYMDELYAAIKKMATWYITERNPKVSAEEKKFFVRAVMSMAHQESYWSHYRKTARGRLQMMRGDYGHGHGLFQVDDRWHFNAVLDGRAANIIMNGLYSLDEYYAAWLKSAKASCISSSTDYYNRARAAYSAYNGGPTKICRWTKPNDTWARNDVGFKAKLDGQSWLKFVVNTDGESDLDISCIAAGAESCGVEIDPPAVNAIGVLPIASYIKLSKTINFRATPNGIKLGALAAGKIYQILGVHIAADNQFTRYYQVMEQGRTGYVFAGDNSTYGDWTEASTERSALYLFQPADQIEVIAYDGIAMWENGLLSAEKIPWGERLKVVELEVTDSLSLFYHVMQNGRKVKIDGGKLGESISLSKDIVIVDPTAQDSWGRFVDSIFYMNIREKKSTSSKIVGVLAGPKTKEQLFKLIRNDGIWCQIQSAEVIGYVKCHYVEKVSR